MWQGGWWEGALWIAAAASAGLLLERVVLVRLQAWAASTPWRGDDIVLGALKGTVSVWCVLIGVWGASWRVPLTPQEFEWIHEALRVALIISLAWTGARAVVGMIKGYARHMPGVPPASSILVNLVWSIMFGVGLLTVLHSLGISIAPLLTALGVGGLAVALALQDTLSNLFAGLHVLVSEQIRPGDWIRLEHGEEGCVADIGWRNTTLRTGPNNLIVIPNAKLATTLVMNYSQPQDDLAAVVTAVVGPRNDLARVEALALEAARGAADRMKEVMTTVEPVVRFQSFQEDGITCAVIVRVRSFPDLPLVKHELIKAVHARWLAAGVEWASPPASRAVPRTT